MLYLRDLFQETMPPGTSPTPTISSGAASSSTLTHGLPERDPQASSSTTSQRVRTRDQGVQKDYEPAFQRVVPQPLPEMRIETFAGPYHHVPGSDTLHIHGNCWGTGGTQDVLNFYAFADAVWKMEEEACITDEIRPRFCSVGIFGTCDG